MARPVPRLFLVRHGETEWSLNGRHTGRTDIPLTPRGVEQVKAQASALVGEGRPVDPKNICFAFVSPRIRAHKTFHLLFEHLPKLPDHTITEEVREWDYGDYEGLATRDILSKDPGWDIWKHGCPGGESAEEMQHRVDCVIFKIRDHHRKWFEKGEGNRDVLVVAHGHFNRCLIARWNNFALTAGNNFNVEPGGVAVLSYNHHTLDEPALDGLNLYAHAK
ncbi:histidine phosphatase superfamily [Scleroderma citrinum]